MPKVKIGIADNSEFHYYQPSWALAAVRLLDFDRHKRPLKSMIPKGVNFLENSVARFMPEENTVSLDDGSKVSYDCLLIACGLEMNYNSVPGIKDALDNDPQVFTIFDRLYNCKAFDALNAYSGDGPAMYTYPMDENFKCRGAAAKILFLSDDVFEKNNIRNRRLVFVTPKDYMFSVPRYNRPLLKIAAQRNIEIRYESEVCRVDHRSRNVTIRHPDGSEEVTRYGLLHFTPEMRTPSAVRSCLDLVDKSGFVQVHPDSMQHVKYPNIFSIGDCSNLPTSKSAAAVSEQLYTVVPNLQITLQNTGEPLKTTYTGYTACPLLCGHKRVVLAEFGYGKKPMETFPLDQSKPSRLIYIVKKYWMPQLYWHFFVKGLWTGPAGMRKWLKRIFFWTRKDVELSTVS